MIQNILTIKNMFYLIIGGLAGISMGTIGIGAGLITMPLLIYSGLSIPQSVAIAMVMQLLPQSAPGVYHYWNYILWIPTILVVIGSIIGIWIGSSITSKKYVSDNTLYRIITVFLFVSAIYFYIKHWNSGLKYDILE